MAPNVEDLNLEARRDFATKLAHEIGLQCLKHFRTKLSITQKAPGDIVTDIDIAMEHVIRTRLQEAWPNDRVFGEESGGKIDNELVWIIDPIDGTTNFYRGIAHWCVSIGALYNGIPVIGVVYDPIHDEMFTAANGLGATMNEQIIRRTDSVSISNATIGIGLTAKADILETLKGIQSLVKQGTTIRAQGAGALTLCHVACGRLDGFLEDQIHLWDICAAAAILKEADCSFASSMDLATPEGGFSAVGSVRIIQDQLCKTFPFLRLS